MSEDRFLRLACGYCSNEPAAVQEVRQLVENQDPLFYEAILGGINSKDGLVMASCKAVVDLYLAKEPASITPPGLRDDMVRILRILQCQGLQATSGANQIYRGVLADAQETDVFKKLDEMTVPLRKLSESLSREAKKQIDILQLLVQGNTFQQELKDKNTEFLAKELSDATVVRDQQYSRNEMQFKDDFLALLSELISTAGIDLTAVGSEEQQQQMKAMKALREKTELDFMGGETSVCDVENEAHLLAEKLYHVRREKTALEAEVASQERRLAYLRAQQTAESAANESEQGRQEILQQIKRKLTTRRYAEARQEFVDLEPRLQPKQGLSDARKAEAQKRREEMELLQKGVKETVEESRAALKLPGELQKLTELVKGDGALKTNAKEILLPIAEEITAAQRKADEAQQTLQKIISEVLQESPDKELSAAASVLSCLETELRALGYKLRDASQVLRPELLDQVFAGITVKPDTTELEAQITAVSAASAELRVLQELLGVRNNESAALLEQVQKLRAQGQKESQPEPTGEEVERARLEVQRKIVEMAEKYAEKQIDEIDRRVAMDFAIPRDAMRQLQAAQNYRLCKKCKRAPFTWVSTQENLCDTCKALPEFSQQQFQSCTAFQ